MAVFKKGKSWVAQVYVGPKPGGGKEYVSRSASSEKEAVLLEAELRLEVASGKRKVSNRRTFNDLLDRWLETADLAETTRYGYQRLVDARIRPALGSVDLRRLTVERLDEFYLQLRTERRENGT